MNPLNELRRSFDGWSRIVRGAPSAAQFFRLDATGVATALGWFLVAILLSVAVQSVGLGMPSPQQLSFGLFTHAVTLAALWLVMSQTISYLKLDLRRVALLVPIIYAMAYMFVVAIPLALIGPAAGLLAVLGAVAQIFRAARVIGGMPLGIAIAFSLLCLLVLVAVPNALYMLFLQIPSPA